MCVRIKHPPEQEREGREVGMVDAINRYCSSPLLNPFPKGGHRTPRVATVGDRLPHPVPFPLRHLADCFFREATPLRLRRISHGRVDGAASSRTSSLYSVPGSRGVRPTERKIALDEVSTIVWPTDELNCRGYKRWKEAWIIQ
ncbi:unnamed protein product [Ixodes persulcatus]